MAAKFSVSSLYKLPRHSTHKARELVMNIVNASDAGLATKEIYSLAVKPAQRAKAGNTTKTPGLPADQEIRSMRYLKTVVLRDLAVQNRVEKIMVTKSAAKFAAAQWVWRPKRLAPTSVPSSPLSSSSSSSSPSIVTSKLATATSTPTQPLTVGGLEPAVAKLTTAAVGVGEDWSHLNKRRQRARKMKVERDVQRMREVQRRAVAPQPRLKH